VRYVHVRIDVLKKRERFHHLFLELGLPYMEIHHLGHQPGFLAHVLILFI
jgi:hypothetical protein